MKRAALYVNGRNRTITAGENGTFYFTLDTRYTDSALSLYSAADIGYKLQGIYNAGSGKLLSTRTAYHFTPTVTGYEIRFTLDSDSYKYTLYPGDASAAKLPYIQAAAKRLAALGYYTPPADAAPGEETSYTTAMAEAAKKFQVMKDLKNTGNIASLTWKALFSEDAPVMESDGEYEKILAEYQARKAAQAEAENIMNGVSIKASSEAGGKIVYSGWSNPAYRIAK